MEILNNALQSLPDTSSQDSKLLINTELMEVQDANVPGTADVDPYVELDRQMCDIVDAM